MSRGIYTVVEAARLLHEKPVAVRRWAFGYRRRGRSYAGAIATDLPPIGDAKAVTFCELVELMFVQGFLRSGVSWPKIHSAAAVARELLGTTHPFAMKKWFADPGGIYALLEETEGETVLVELSGAGQIAMRETLAMYLEQLDFDLDGFAARWHPLGKDLPVVVDPHLIFGAPVVKGTRMPTSILYRELHGTGIG